MRWVIESADLDVLWMANISSAPLIDVRPASPQHPQFTLRREVHQLAKSSSPAASGTYDKAFDKTPPEATQLNAEQSGRTVPVTERDQPARR